MLFGLKKESLEAFKKLNESIPSVSFNKIDIDEEFKSKLIFSDIEIFANEDIYFFIQNNKIVFQGYVSIRGVEGTIEKDLKIMPEFINLIMAITLDDKKTINYFISDKKFFNSFLDQDYYRKMAKANWSIEKSKNLKFKNKIKTQILK
jgi:hypothetical protein